MSVRCGAQFLHERAERLQLPAIPHLLRGGIESGLVSLGDLDRRHLFILGHNTDVRGRSYAPIGQTQVAYAVGGNRQKLSMIATVTNQGKGATVKNCRRLKPEARDAGLQRAGKLDQMLHGARHGIYCRRVLLGHLRNGFDVAREVD